MIEGMLSVLADYRTYVSLFIFLIGVLLKLLLDLNLGILFVKYFYWLSVRSIFRNKSNKISGVYKQHWSLGRNNNYNAIADRQSLITLKQFNNYCYGEFTSKNDTYYLFGELIDRKIIGHWSDQKSKLGYFGSFELTIIDRNRIEGIWVGHSNKNPEIINRHRWKFKAVTDNTRFLVAIQITILFKKIWKRFRKNK